MSSRCITTCKENAPSRNLVSRIPFGRPELCAVFFLLSLTIHARAARVVGSDTELRRALIGTWEVQLPARDFPLKRGFSTYRGDGRLQVLAIGEVSGIDTRLDLEGRWTVQNGVLTETITNAPASSLVGKSANSTLVSVEPNQIILVDDKKRRLTLHRSTLPKNLPRVSPLMSEMIRSTELKKAYATYTPQPRYPYSSFKNNREGKGIFRLIVNQDGTVGSVQVVRTTGDADLDEAATTALHHWRFKAGMVKSLVTPVTFTMHRL
jgi:TonB family protein